ncbi:Cytoplasmic and mitochondrial histidine tRNA synthetase [Exophiala dermatitidis]|nr:Cytoplasmic and mitochondrial histidine tRNA synthetase [Exophiala dermatitidis]KAJ4546840.1 Cytoplasmic and mitochondrial histidine tRNA synthetase [Exophiala dermatitidis]KAJ4573794.1 Cytoplasmic and mitochondrial histidine tRNA synthetase [Exophiala dermatitidis]KAJ4583954.1 Cytoplasmic and mitochondrial histidine tRNA synthetase [Exophiala dermatitidis]KAJ4623738.1 Cytoplasmic and mitochondrial histidine tRNA synthetase [Exophiala dermatitidis]
MRVLRQIYICATRSLPSPSFATVHRPPPVHYLVRHCTTMGKDKEKKQELIKNPKGTRDWSGEDVDLLEDILAQISRVFRRHGGKKLDTPVFEREEVLKGKYGEDSKLIYDLKDQGGELLSLRYDLTVPFARWLAMNANIKSYKRFAISKVYRRDQPAIAKGRMREFYQCDIDFAGASDPMMADSEVIAIIVEVFESLEWNGRYTIKLNDRRILDGLFEVCGVPEDKIRAISSAVDKLDKMPWEEVKKEMVETKGLDEVVADKIQTYVTRKGGRDLLEDLQKDEALMSNAKAKKGVEEMEILMDYLSAWGALDKISFDLSLARGLDYYTGVIYEVITEGSAPVTANGSEVAKEVQKQGKKEKKVLDEDEDRSNDPSVGIGSVAAGGRYDHLVERFRPNADLPCVGVSFGVDRIFSITKARIAKGETFSYISSNAPDVYIMAFGGGGFDGMAKQRIEIAKLLLDAGLKVEFTYKKKPKPQVQFKNAEQAGAPFAVILGEDEQAKGEVRVKEMGLPDGHPEKEGVLVKIADLAAEVTKRVEMKKVTTRTGTIAVS